MRTQKEISIDVKKLTNVQSKLGSDLKAIELDESKALAKIESELCETGTSKAASDLVELRVRKGVVSHELNLISARLRNFQAETQDLALAELTIPWTQFELSLPTRIASIRGELLGLKGHLEELKAELLNLTSSAARKSQDSVIICNGLIRVGHTGMADIIQLVQGLDYVEQVYNNSHMTR